MKMVKTSDSIKVAYLNLYENFASLGEKQILIIVGQN